MDLQALEGYRDEALTELGSVNTPDEIKAWYQKHLAPSGAATALKRQIGQVPREERRAFGQTVNVVGKALEAAFEARKTSIEKVALEAQLESERVDVTLPPRSRRRGRRHPITETMREVCRIFGDMGFSIYESRHVETDAFNFEYLNMPPHHRARDMQDTFYISDNLLLRTHTSGGQIHAMREFGPGPVRVIVPGRVYRNEDVTARSEMQFHQVEGLMVGPDVRMSDLKGVLLQFAQRCFGGEQAVRLRGNHFPFTEPSVEVDVRCAICNGSGCRVCKYTGWLELLGAGLVHPVVLRHGGYDPAKVRGIAFGIGIERLVMLRHSIDDIRHFFRNDLRFLSQFN